jgi:hypothetical protein
MHFNTILPSTSRSFNSHLFFRFTQQNPMSNTCRMPNPSHSLSTPYGCPNIRDDVCCEHQTLPAGTSPCWCADIPRETVSALNSLMGAGWAWSELQERHFSFLQRFCWIFGCRDVTICRWLVPDLNVRATQCGIAIVVACMDWSGWTAGHGYSSWTALPCRWRHYYPPKRLKLLTPPNYTLSYPGRLIFSYSSVRTPNLSLLQCIIHHPSHNFIQYEDSS